MPKWSVIAADDHGDRMTFLTDAETPREAVEKVRKDTRKDGNEYAPYRVEDEFGNDVTPRLRFTKAQAERFFGRRDARRGVR